MGPQFLDGEPDPLVDRPFVFPGFPEPPPQPFSAGNDLLDEDSEAVFDQHIGDLPVALEPGDHRGG